MSEHLQERKKNIIYIRGIFTFIITILALYNLDYILDSRGYIFIYLFVLIVSNVFFMLMPPERFDGMKMHYILFLMDIILLALGAYWLAYLDFKFFMIMFLTIFISAMSQSVKLSILIALVVNILYIYLKTAASGTGFDSMIRTARYLICRSFL